MKIISLIKSIPFLLTLFIILILSISNQKEYTKLKILLWNTPSLSIGSYIAISTGTGFILSYIVTNNFGKRNELISREEIKYKSDVQNDDSKIYPESNNDICYDNTLIERDIKEPSPTINASFRVIGKTNRINKPFMNNDTNDSNNLDYSSASDYLEYKEDFNYNKDNEINRISNDWDDDDYLNW